MAHYPSFTSDFEFRAASREEAFDRLASRAQESGLLEVASYQAPTGSKAQPGDWSGARKAFLALPEDGSVTVLLEDAQRREGGGLVRLKDRPQMWRSHWSARPDANESERDGARKLAALAHVLEALMRDGALSSASLTRQHGGAACVPDPPLAAAVEHAVTVTQPEIDAGYDRPQDFLSLGWSRHVEQGGLFLCMRALGAVSAADYLREVQPLQWALARAAKPHLTRYYDVTFEEGEEEVFRSGEPRLELVGYMTKSRTMEYSCVLGAGRHIQGWEIRDLEGLVRAKRLPDGQPLESVRVVFAHRKEAEAEKRPLLDVGVRVFYMDERSQDVEIEE